MTKKGIKIIILCVILATLMMAMTGCTFEYGNEDSLGVGSMTVGQRIWLGTQVALLGIGLVFVVLITLILCIKAIQFLTLQLEKLTNARKQRLLENNKKNESKENVETVVSSVAEQDDEIVAAIMAAINVCLAQENYKSDLKFKVRSIKQIK